MYQEKIMLQTREVKFAFNDKALASFFSASYEVMADEVMVLGEVAQALLDAGMQLTNKNLIVCLVKALESTEDIVQADVIRKTLEIVVGYTSDDF